LDASFTFSSLLAHFPALQLLFLGGCTLPAGFWDLDAASEKILPLVVEITFLTDADAMLSERLQMAGTVTTVTTVLFCCELNALPTL
jgi:hypothetical protein